MNIIRRVAFSSGWLWSLASLFCQGTLFAQFEKLNESWRWAQFSSENGLPSSRVFGIAETPSGKIWATTEFGLAWFDGYCWHAVGKEEGVPGVRARAVVPDAAGQVFVLLDGNLYHGGEHGFRRILLTHKGQTMPVSFFVGLPDHRYLLVSDSSLYAFRNDTVLPYVATPEVSQQRVTGVWATADGGLWINTLNGLFRKVGNEWAVVLPASRRPLAVTRVVAGTDGRAIAYIQAPRIRKGVWEFDLRRRPRHAFADPSEFIQSMDIGPNGDAVLCIETGGLRVRHGSVWNSLVRPPEQMKNVLFVKFRDNGDLWAGSEDALHLYRSSSKRWSFWVHDEVSGRNSTNAILRTRDGSLWLARGIGLEVHKKDNTIQVFERIGNVTLNAVTGLAQDTAGHVWISSGSAFEGAYRWDGVAWKHFGVNEGLVTGYIHKIAIDRKGSPWFLAITKHDFGSRDDGTGPGAFVYSQGAFTKWGTEEGLLSGRVYAFVEGLQGEYWFGTDLGLSRWRSGQWKHWTAAEGLRSARIYTITYDKQNRLWFGNQNNGLGVLENDVPRYFTTADGLVSNAVWDIRTNSDGRLWIATHGGLSSYWEGTWASFGASSGLSYSRLWPVLPEGNKIYVGTVGGGTAILDLEEAGKHDPIVVPTLPVVENGSVLLRWNAYSYFASVGQQDIETRFRIDDGQWSMWSRNREVTVANLALGEHKVTIHAKSEYGTYDSLGRSVSFSIPSPFYRRPLYYLPMSAMFVALIWLALIAAARKRRLDKALVLSEAQHRAVVEDQSEFIMRFLPDGTRTFVNLAYCHEYGKGVAELVGENFFGSLSGEASERVRNKLAGLTPREPVATDEHCSISPNGEIRWHQWTDRAIFNEEGQLVEFQAVGHDITVRKRAENSLRMFQYSIDQASDAVFWMTRDAGFSYVNDKACTSLGYTREELLKLWDIDPIFPKHLWNSRWEGYQEHRQGGTESVETFHQRKDGTTFPVDVISKHLWFGDEELHVAVVRDVTERKRMDEALRLTRFTIDNVADAVYWIDPHARIVDVNAAASEMLGFTREQLLSMSLYDINADMTPERWKTIWSTITSKGKLTFETRHTTADGRIIPVEIIANHIAFGDRELDCAFVRDITERKRVEEVIRESQRRLSLFFNQSLDGFYFSMLDEPQEWNEDTDKDEVLDYVFTHQRITEINDAMLAQYGAAREDILGRPVSAFFHHDSEQGRLLRRRLFDEGRIHIETSERKIDGTPIWIEGDYMCIYDERHKIIGTFGVQHDITERKRAEEALRASEEQLRHITENMSDVVLEGDERGLFRYISPSFHAALGYKASDFIGKPLFDLVHPDDYTRVKRQYLLAALPEKGAELEFRCRHANGHYVHASVIGTGLVDEKGRRKGAVLSCRDVTERKNAEELVKASLREKEVLLKEIHHRVKNNLQVISSLLNLQSQYVKDQQSLSLFKDSQSRVKSMALIHEKLYQSEDFANIDFALYVRNLTGFLYRSYVIDPNIVTIVVDIQNIQLNMEKAIPCGLIINELVSNSLKYAFPSGNSGRICVALSACDDSMLTMIVRDNGVGLPEHISLRATESLGLQLVASLADQLGATIDVKRAGGTEYEISFPR